MCRPFWGCFISFHVEERRRSPDLPERRIRAPHHHPKPLTRNPSFTSDVRPTRRLLPTLLPRTAALPSVKSETDDSRASKIRQKNRTQRKTTQKHEKPGRRIKTPSLPSPYSRLQPLDRKMTSRHDQTAAIGLALHVHTG
ncbi:unnamed protein product [Ectocarpus sp. 12 AP-2014]